MGRLLSTPDLVVNELVRFYSDLYQSRTHHTDNELNMCLLTLELLSLTVTQWA